VTASHDVIIVGGGPAGSTAARTLALGGAKVLVVDRAGFPRNKPCGGGLTTRALKRFPHLGSALERISTHTIRRIHMEAPGGESVTVETDRPTIILVRRIEFDHVLLGLAREAGADAMERVEITRAAEEKTGVRLESRDGRVFAAPIVVAADGAYSTVARRLGLNPGWPPDRVAIDMMEETPAERLRATSPDTLWVRFALEPGHGYGYVFPKAGYVNVGAGYLVSSFRKRPGESLRARHAAFVDGLRERGLLQGHANPAGFTAYQIPMGGPLSTTARGRVYVAGDAGGFVNGFSAEGIFFAMVTGDLAGQAILRGPSPRLYERSWRREIGAELRDSRFLNQIAFADPGRLDRMLHGIRALPQVAELLAEYATGVDTYAGVRRRFVSRFPLVGAKLAARYVSGRWRGWLGRAAERH
jgi:geranylgeranyl reductase family protein